MKTIAALFLALLGAYSLAGGVAGFVTKQSLPSLIAGGVAGLLLLAAIAANHRTR